MNDAKHTVERHAFMECTKEREAFEGWCVSNNCHEYDLVRLSTGLYPHEDLNAAYDAWMHQQQRVDSLLKWNPIDTAPKDGTHILVMLAGDADFNRNPPTVAHWFDGGWWPSVCTCGEHQLSLSPIKWKSIMVGAQL